MSMFKETKEMIDATIYENGNGEITAQNVNLAMHGMLDAVETEVEAVKTDVEAVKDKVAEIEKSAGSGVLRVWYSPVVELTEKQINDNKASYNEIRNGGAIDSVYYIVEEGVIGYPHLLATGLEGGIVAVVAANIAIGPNGEVTAENATLVLSEDGTVTLLQS